jgi:osmotically-inducible protein OsmY
MPSTPITLAHLMRELRLSNGCVTAEGHVGWQFQKDAALKVIRNVAGVRKVIDKITVKPRVLPGDAETELNVSISMLPISRGNGF